MIKLAFALKRAPGLTQEQFVDHHRNRHAPLFTSIPETQQYVRKYVVSHPILAPSYPPPSFDGLTEIWFDSWQDHDAFFSSDNYKTRVQPDEPTFIDLANSVSLVTEEKVVL